MHLNLMAPMFPQLDVNIPEGWWKQDAQLDLDFANKRAYNKFTQFRGRPDSILTYTSPSPKMVYDVDGVLRYAPHNLVLNSGFSLGTDGALPTSWLERGAVTLRRRASENCAVLAASTGGTVGSSDDAREVISGLQVGKQFYVTFKAARDPSSVANVLTAVFAGTSINCNLTSGYQDFSFVATASGISHSLFFGNAIGAAGNLVALIKDVQVAAYPVYSEYIPTTSAAVYSLPIDHAPITHAPLGVLIEEQRTNLFVYSQDTSVANWATSETTKGNNTATAPDGTNTADKIIESTTATSNHYDAQAATTTAVTHTFSRYVKASGRSWMLIYHPETTSGLLFDLATGVTGGKGAASNLASGGITPVGDGWYRCWITVLATAASNNFRTYPAVDGSSLGTNYTGDGTSGLLVWGAQLEAGAFPTSYIPTVASQVTRAADQVSIATSAFNFVDATGTCVVELDTNFDVAAYARDIVRFTDGSNDYVRPYAYPSRAGLSIVDSSVQCDISVGSGRATGVPFSLACAWADNDMAAVVNGGTVGVDTSGTMPTGMTTVRIGFSAANTNVLSGHIKRLTYWNTRKSNAELQGLSA